jgi:gamma-tubulin complex component 2
LLVFLNDIANDRQTSTASQQISQPQIQPAIPDKPVLFEIKIEEKTTLKPIFESTPLSSTRITENSITPSNTVNEVSYPVLQQSNLTDESTTFYQIKEKIALATSGGLRLSAGMTSTPASTLSQKLPQKSLPEITIKNLWNFNFEEIIPMQNNRSTVAIPAASQELIVMKELLYCLIGIPGSLIAPKPPSISTTALEFKVSDQLQESLRDMIMEILPLANYYWQIQTFIQEKSTMESGQVLQALCAAVRGIMTDYLMSITQLETLYNRKKLNLHKLLYFLRPIMHTMELLAQTLITISTVGSFFFMLELCVDY